MRTVNNQKRLEKLVSIIKSVELKSFKKNGMYNIKFKKFVIIDGIPEEKLAEYTLRELAGCLDRIACKVEEYLKLTKERCEQVELELFGEDNEPKSLSELVKRNNSILDDPQYPIVKELQGIPGSSFTIVDAQGISTDSDTGKIG